MKHRVWLSTLYLLIAYGLRTFAADWTSVVDRVAKSIVLVENDRGLCTGIVINSAYKDDKDTYSLILTAAHCYGEHLYADQEPARVKWKDEKKDLLVLQISESGKPALMLAKDDPKRGSELASLGFGYGTVMDQAMFRIAHVSAVNLFVAADGIGGPLIATDATFVGGQSGGPCVNTDGEVVMIVQMGTSAVGLGVGADVLRSKVGKYWEKSKAPKP